MFLHLYKICLSVLIIDCFFFKLSSTTVLVTDNSGFFSAVFSCSANAFVKSSADAGLSSASMTAVYDALLSIRKKANDSFELLFFIFHPIWKALTRRLVAKRVLSRL